MEDEEKLKFSEGNGGICLRLLFLLIASTGLALSIVTITGCDFLKYEPREPPEGVEDTRPPILQGIDRADVGLYQYDPDNDGCREITDDFDDLSGSFTAARVGSAIGAIMGMVGIFLVLVDLCCCRFPASRPTISVAFLLAFVGQCLTFLAYAAPLCDPNFKDGPYPCSPDRRTFMSMSAAIMYIIACLLACCIPKPMPIVMRLRRQQKGEKNDGCCAICRKKPEEEEEGEEKGDKEETTVEEGEEMELDLEGQQELLHEQQTAAAVATALAEVRRGKQEEIEKQLELLTLYKDHYSEEEYNEKVMVLMAALPDPNTYEAYTKTDALLPPPQEDLKEMDAGDGDEEAQEGEEGEEGEEEEEEKSFVKKIGSTMSSATKVFRSKKTPEELAPEAAVEAPTEPPVTAEDIVEPPVAVEAVVQGPG